MSAASIERVVCKLTQYVKCKGDSIARLRAFLKCYEIQILSATGQEFSSLESCTHVEEALSSIAARRVDPNFIVLTRDNAFDSQGLRIVNYAELEKLIQEPDIAMAVPLLSLGAEYASMMTEIDSAILQAVAEARYIMGPQVAQFEQACATYIGVKHAIGVASGTDALVLALRSLAIQRKGKEYFEKDDLIITTPFTFTATGDAILRAGATPLFVDIDPDTFNLQVEHIHRLISSTSFTPPNAQIIGILPVHLYGQSCNMDAFVDLAQAHDPSLRCGDHARASAHHGAVPRQRAWSRSQ